MTDPVRAGAEHPLLLFRKVDEPDRRARARQLLDAGMGGWAWRLDSDLDLWELRDLASGEEEPVAAAATCALGDGRRARLLAVVVDAASRGRGIGLLMIDEVVDALRTRGVLVLVTAVPVDQTRAMATVQGARFRPSHVERVDGTTGGHDLVWFDVQL